MNRVHTHAHTHGHITHPLFCFVFTTEILILITGKGDCYTGHWPCEQITAIFTLDADECYLSCFSFGGNYAP